MLSEPWPPGQRFHHPGPFDKAGQARAEVGRVAVFAGHLFEGRGNLAQRFGPARQAVGEEEHVEAHVAVILRHGHRGEDRRFAGGDRHVGGVGDNDGALHERPPAARILELGKFIEQAGHLVAAFTAADIDHDVDIGVLGDGLLKDRLAGAEAAGHDGDATLEQGKEKIEAALTGDQRRGRRQLASIGTCVAHRPAVPAVQSLIIFEGRGRLLKLQLAAMQLRQGAVLRRQQQVLDVSLHDRAEGFAALQCVTRLALRAELPRLRLQSSGKGS